MSNIIDRFRASVFFIGITLIFTSCLTSAKLDKYVSEQYQNQVPKAKEIKKANIVINSTLPSSPAVISNTVQKTSKVLPLIVYWSFDWRHTCQSNPGIALSSFSNSVNSLASKSLLQKVGDKRLELTVEQTPRAFAIVDKAHMIWLIYPISWDRIYIEPDLQDMVVSYKLSGTDSVAKSGKITVKGIAKNKGIRFFQSWKSATSEYLMDYNADLAAMTKSFVNKLTEEL